MIEILQCDLLDNNHLPNSMLASIMEIIEKREKCENHALKYITLYEKAKKEQNLE